MPDDVNLNDQARELFFHAFEFDVGETVRHRTAPDGPDFVVVQRQIIENPGGFRAQYRVTRVIRDGVPCTFEFDEHEVVADSDEEYGEDDHDPELN